MSYVASVLQPGERIIRIGRLHWIVYWQAILLAVLALLCVPGASTSGIGFVMMIAAAALAMLAAVVFALAWFDRWITEIAITDRRIIYKRGFINRRTVEMNMDKVAAVDIDQSILGRLLDYGSIHVIGLGAAQAGGPEQPRGGIEHLHRVAQPIELRNAITAK